MKLIYVYNDYAQEIKPNKVATRIKLLLLLLIYIVFMSGI